MPSENYNDERHKREELARREKRKVNIIRVQLLHALQFRDGEYLPPSFTIAANVEFSTCISHLLLLASLLRTKRAQNPKNPTLNERKNENERNTSKRRSKNTEVNAKSKKRHPR